MIDATQLNAASPFGASTAAERPGSPEEAARQFEQVLVRQFVDVMTKDLFDGGLSGEDGPAWMNGQRDMQRDTLGDVLTEHLVDSGTLRLSDLLLRQWGQDQAAPPTDDAAAPASKLPPRPLDAEGLDGEGDDADLRL